MGALRELLTKVVSGGSGSKEPQTEREAVGKWQDELRHAKKFFEKFHKQAQRAVDRFLDDKRKGEGEAPGTAPLYRLNLYHSNIETLQSMLFAKIPKAEADRRFYDPNDDVARVAAEMITRIIQNDMNDPDDKLNDVLKSALQDRLITGLGSGRVKYYIEETPTVDPATGQPALDPTTQAPVMQKSDEWCDTIYVHWRDILWSPSRVASELRWKAFRSYMTKEDVAKRWGEDVAELIPYAKSAPRLNADKLADLENPNPEAEIWEIWDSVSKTTFWVVEAYDKFLGQEPDPMELGGFYPDAKPMLANTSTSKYLPKPDFYFAQDLYSEIDELETRIALLTQAAKCVGVYDRSSKDIGRMLKEGVENELIPVDNWAMFAEKGGLKGMTDWLPLEAVVIAISTLSAQQVSRINQLYQVTGFSDIMRGQATQPNVTATEQRIKDKFGSGRIQAIQEEFATFAADLLNKKVQLIQRFYDADRIKKLSNIMNTPDAKMADQAIALIKNPDEFNVRISVKSESMAQENTDAIREQRAALMQGMAQFMGMAAPLLEQSPESAPFLLELLSFSVAGFNGAAEMEGVIDQFGAQLKQSIAAKAAAPPPPPPPDPAVIKAQADAQTAQAKIQADAQMQQQKLQSDAQVTAMQEHFKAQTMQLKEQFAAERAHMIEQMKNDRTSQTDQLKAATAIIVAQIGAKQAAEAAELAASKEVAADVTQ
jgi:hypothetical protein